MKTLFPTLQNLRGRMAWTILYGLIGSVAAGVTGFFLGSARTVDAFFEQVAILFAYTAIPVMIAAWLVARFFPSKNWKFDRWGAAHGVLTALLVVWIATVILVLAGAIYTVFVEIGLGTWRPQQLVQLPLIIGWLAGMATLCGSPVILVLGTLYGRQMKRL